MWTSLAVCVGMCLILAKASPVSKSTLQLEHCSWGAQYWCSSPQTANLCGKTEWCSKNDWSSDLIQDFPCTVTQQLIKNTRGLISSAAEKPVTESDYAVFVAKGCITLKDNKARQLCKELATKEDVINKLVKLLSSKLSVQAVSIAVGLCKKDIPKDKECPRCADVVSTAQKYIHRLFTEDAYMKLIDTECAKLGQGKQLCLVIGKDKYTDFYNGLINAPAESLCKGTSQCFDVPTNFLALQSSSECEICTAVVAEIRQLDRSQDVQTVVKNLFKSVCSKLGVFEQLCNNLAQEGLQVVFEFIATEMEPDVICEDLKLCNQPEQKTIQRLDGSVECEICEIVIQNIDVLIAANVTEANLEEFFTSICDPLPPPINDKCNGFVKSYTPEIIKMILQRLNDTKFCSTLGFCKNGTNASQDKIQPKLPKLQNDQLCGVCKLVVTYLDTFLDSNSSEAEIEAVLDKVCTILPGNWSQQCETLVKEYGPIIVELLKAELKPGTVCTVLKLCNGTMQAASQNTVQPKLPKLQNGQLCGICKLVVTYLDTFLDSSSSEAEIEAVLDKVCTILPGNWSQQCETLVKQYGPIIVELLKAELKPGTVCAALKFCNGTTQAPVSQVRIPPKLPKQSESKLCDVCKLVVTLLDNYLNTSSSEAEVEAILDKVCTMLPVNLTQPCEALVKQYGPIIVQLLQAELQPITVCTVLKFCTGTKQAASQVKFQPTILKPKDELCSLCKYVVAYLDSFVKQNATVAELETLLDKVCTALPNKWVQQCESLVQQYGPLIVQLLEEEVAPDKVCTAIGLCTADKEATSQTKAQPISVAKSNDEECDLCKYAVSYLDSFLAQNSTEAEVEALLEQVCSILPSSLKQQCDSLVKQYGPLIVELLKAELDPSRVCIAVGLCTANRKATSQTKTQPISVAKSNDEECDLCKYAVSYLDSFLAQNSTEAEVEALLEKVCSIVPSSLKGQCDSLVKQYGPLIVQLLEAELDPDRVCIAIGLCTANKQAATSQVKLQTKILSKPNDIKCEGCKYVVTYLDTYLEKNATEQEVEALLDKVCAILPESAKQECIDLVKQYGSLIVEMLKQGAQPDTVCTALGLCTETQKIAAPAVSKSLQVQKVGKQKTELCALCVAVVQYLEGVLEKNATQKKIISVLDTVCELLPGNDKELCIQQLPMYTGYVVNLIDKELPPNLICKVATICLDDVAAPISLAPVKKGELCPLCQIVFTTLENILKKNASEAEIVAALDKVCDILPSTIKEECLAFVKLYIPYVVELIVQELTPDQICQTLGLCTAAVKQVGQSQVTQMNAVSSVKSSVTCTVCIEIFQILDQILPEQATEAEIEKALNQVCTYLSTYKDACVKIIAEYTPFVVDFITKKFTPKQICDEIRLCTNGSAVAPKPLQSLMFQSEITSSKATPPGVMKYCSACKFALYEIQTAMEDPLWQNKSKTILTDLCATLESGQAECRQLVDANFAFLLSEITAFRFPIIVCQVMNLCEAPATMQGSENDCTFCKGLAMVVNSYAQQNKTVDEIKVLAASTCHNSQIATGNQCLTKVQEYTPQLFQLMSQNHDPASACEAAAQCTKSSQRRIFPKL
jgi:saposin